MFGRISQSIPLSLDREKDLHDALVLSRLVGGRVNNNRVVEINNTYTVMLEKGETWVSYETIIRDVETKTGVELSRQNARTIINRLMRRGLVLSKRTANRSGTLGSVFKLSPDVTKGDLRDVVSEANIIIWGDPKEYTEGFLVQSVTSRRKYHSGVDKVMKDVARTGRDGELYASLGRWKRGTGGDHSESVYVPMVVIDIDRPSIQDAYNDTLDAIDILTLQGGIGTSYVSVAVSGSKGFHIFFPSSVLGRMIFSSFETAQYFLCDFFGDLLGDIQIDTSVFVPTQPIRVVGSKHGKTGLYKTAWTLDEFVKLSLQDALEASKDGKTFFYRQNAKAHDRTVSLVGESEARVIEKLQKLQERSSSGGGAGECIKAALRGCGEADTWYGNHTGRHKLIWILSRFYLERKPEKEAWDIVWQANLNNTPPLDERQVRREFTKAKRQTGLM